MLWGRDTSCVNSGWQQGKDEGEMRRVELKDRDKEEKEEMRLVLSRTVRYPQMWLEEQEQPGDSRGGAMKRHVEFHPLLLTTTVVLFLHVNDFDLTTTRRLLFSTSERFNHDLPPLINCRHHRYIHTRFVLSAVEAYWLPIQRLSIKIKCHAICTVTHSISRRGRCIGRCPH